MNCTGYTSASGNVSYEWDAQDRLVAYNRAPYRSEFTYDGYGRRVKIVEKDNGTVTSTKQFVWCGKTLCQERDVNNNVTKRFFADGEQDNGVRYFTKDHLGSIREMTGEGGAILARYDYDPYGRRTKVSGTFEADFGFTGYYVHQPSGLQLALYRAYDADVGRWLSRDPIQEGGGINLYGYVRENPLNKIDLMEIFYGLLIQNWPAYPIAWQRPESRHANGNSESYELSGKHNAKPRQIEYTCPDSDTGPKI